MDGPQDSPAARLAARSSARPAGRPRRKETETAIFDAAGGLLRDHGYAGVTMEAVAAAAGVAKTTVYRRWSNRGALLLDLYMRGFPTDEEPDTGDGSPRMALIREIGYTIERLSDPVWAATLRALVAEAQGDPVVADALRERVVGPRRDRARAILDRMHRPDGELDVDAVLDALFGAIWYRLLLGHATLDRTFAGRLVRSLL